MFALPGVKVKPAPFPAAALAITPDEPAPYPCITSARRRNMQAFQAKT